MTPPFSAATFDQDVQFLRQHVEVVVLSDAQAQAQVALVPAYQGRVMTSTASGAQGLSHGWVNRDLIASGKTQPHINVYGGEDRFWLGPEGGQFSIFFAPGVPFDLEHWFTPPGIDTEPFPLVRQKKNSARFERTLSLTNYSGTRFQVQVTRDIRLLNVPATLKRLGTSLPPGVRAVGFESVNTIRNVGPRAWDKTTGLLSIWMLGMFNASPLTTVAIPYQPGPTTTLGPVVNDDYFGRVPADRLRVLEDVLLFRADAAYRSKIGVAPRRAKPVLGSYDASTRVLTLVEYTLPRGATDYVNSQWKLQDQPFAGDVVNSYNDGPASPGGSQLGKFYELESSSPALALDPGQTAKHTHRTIHLEGPSAALDAIARATLGLETSRITLAPPATPSR